MMQEESQKSKLTVISRYLGMFSLDQNVQTFVIVLDTVISRYLGMFSLDF